MKSKYSLPGKSAFLIHRLRYLILGIWVLAALASIPFALRVDDNLVAGGFSSDQFDSVQAANRLSEKLGVPPSSVSLIFSHSELDVYDPQFTAAVDRVVEQFRSLPEFVTAYDYRFDPTRVSADAHTAVVTIGLSDTLEDAVDVVGDTLRTLDAEPLQLIATGGPLLYRDLVAASGRDVRRGEFVVVWLVLVVLLLFMRTIGGALMPIVTGGIGTLVGLMLVYLLSQITQISFFALNVVTLLSLGLAIDYALLFIYRYRDELRNGLDPKMALVETQSNVAQTVLFSALTSMVGLSSLAFFDLLALKSIAYAALVTIPVVALAALTLMPACLAILGRGIERFPVVPRLSRRVSIVSPLAYRVMRYPWAFLAVVGILLTLVVLPVGHIRLGGVDATVLPDDFESKQGLDILVEQFGAGLSTNLKVMYEFEGDAFSPQVIEELHSYGKRLELLEGVERVSSYVNLLPELTSDDYINLYAVPRAVLDPEARLALQYSVRDGAVLFGVASPYNPLTRDAQNLVRQVRAIQAREGSATYVTGGAAFIKDLSDYLVGILPWAALAVLAVTYLALLFMFRSLLLPLKAVVLNIFSIAASFGALVFVFQDGNLSGVLNFSTNGTTSAPILVILFGVLFGVSMDYEIFLLARISDFRRRGLSNTKAVVAGMLGSAGVITGSAAVLIVVGLGFLTADVVLVKAFGLGLAIAVFVDATLVRLVATPALMRIAGKWNWYLPRWLDRILPNTGIGI